MSLSPSGVDVGSALGVALRTAVGDGVSPGEAVDSWGVSDGRGVDGAGVENGDGRGVGDAITVNE